MNLELQNKAVLVTGGASGIGEAIVRRFLAEGARVAVVDRNSERGERLVRELWGVADGRVRFQKAELTEESDCQRAVHETLTAWGGLDVLINNAGVNDTVGLERSPQDFLASLRRNLFHIFTLTHFAREALIASGGTIVNITSKVSVTGQGGTSGYAAAKGGVNALTREWAVTLAPHGVRVNAVAPAECDTPLYEAWFQAQADPAQARRLVERLVPLGQRLTSPQEIADTVAFLASTRASHITGQIIFVDGGYTHLDRAVSVGRPI